MLKLRETLWSFILQPESEGQVVQETSRKKCYDPISRNPLYCAADTSCLWELSVLQTHYHPSVQAFAKKLVAVRSDVSIAM